MSNELLVKVSKLVEHQKKLAEYINKECPLLRKHNPEIFEVNEKLLAECLDLLQPEPDECVICLIEIDDCNKAAKFKHTINQVKINW